MELWLNTYEIDTGRAGNTTVTINYIYYMLYLVQGNSKSLYLSKEKQTNNKTLIYSLKLGRDI